MGYSGMRASDMHSGGEGGGSRGSVLGEEINKVPEGRVTSPLRGYYTQKKTSLMVTHFRRRNGFSKGVGWEYPHN